MGRMMWRLGANNSWQSPEDRVRNQTDITINKIFKNSIRQVKMYPGAGCIDGCDHAPVVKEMKVKLKKLKRIKKEIFTSYCNDNQLYN